ncbi:MAG: superoxide dismutase family protein [Acidobacteriia bacterium]|nr:superoxide dismutase family protein [Terriglobia bacterium]
MRHARGVLVFSVLMLPAAVLRAEDPATAAGTGRVAVASVQPLGGANATGMVRFIALEHGVEISADIKGLTPGTHGFHVHEFGDCSAADGSSAGGHFNPEGQPHGGPDSAAAHAGDYGNLDADASGHAVLKLVSHRISLEQGASGVIGRAVVVHGKADDLTSQPAGNAGPRIGCGVIMLQGATTTAITKK